MKEYILGLALAGVAVSIAELLSHGALKKTVKAALGLLLISFAVAPLTKGAFLWGRVELEGAAIEENVYTGGLAEACADAYEEGIRIAVAEKVGLDEGQLSVSCLGFDLRAVKAEEVTVSIVGRAGVVDTDALKKFVEENFTDGGRCKIEIAEQ